MSIAIRNVAIHRIARNEQSELEVCLRDKLLSNDSSTESLVCELHRSYCERTAKGFGFLKESSSVLELVRQSRSGNLSFLQFSETCVERLVAELSKYPFADQGVLVMAEYRSLATDYLFFGIMPVCSTLQVDQLLDLRPIDYLNFSKMDIAALINLTDLETNPDNKRYLSFVMGRVGRRVSDFFLDFLEADSGFDVKQQNQILLQAVSDYCSDKGFEKEEAVDFKKSVFNYCDGQYKGGEEVQLRGLCNELDEVGTQFASYIQDQGYELQDSFPAKKAEIERLRKYVGIGGGVRLHFDSSLLGERIFYEAESDSLTIRGLPPGLRDQLIRTLT